MKRILLALVALMLCAAGCQPAAEAQEAATLNDVIAAASDSGVLPAGEDAAEEAEEAETVQWDGEFVDAERSVTLTLDAKGVVTYRFSSGGVGRLTDVSGSTAKSDSICFSLSGDTLSILGDAYTGNYTRK